MIDYSRYPKNWKEVSQSIRLRSKGVCECCGECGKHIGRCSAENYKPHPITGSKVVLTVAHMGYPRNGRPGNKRDKMDVRRRNLKAMCQRCHLLFDLDEHKENARATRRKKIIEAGQYELL